MTLVAFPSVEPPLPHVLVPCPEESLLSFMLRLDAINGWPVGETAKLVSLHVTGWRRATATMWAAGTVWDLRRLARLSENPLEAIEALTWLPDLRAATNDPGLAITALGDAGPLRFCPVCLANEGTIPRSCFLPLVDICPRHGVWMERFCPAHGASSGDFHTYPPVVEGGRIACAGCGRELATPVGRAVDAEALAHLRDTWRAWTFLLGWRGDDIRGRGYRTVRAIRRGYPLRDLGQAASFARLVTVFLALQIEPELIATLEEHPARPCPNASCPRHLAPGPDDPLSAGRQVEHHCACCGARFVGRRLLLCFDPDHGSTHPSVRSVRKARHRLDRWREALADACRDDILAGRPITVTGTFRRAGVPLNANLRATRLGLVALVRDAARRQRLLTGREPARSRRPRWPSTGCSATLPSPGARTNSSMPPLPGGSAPARSRRRAVGSSAAIGVMPVRACSTRSSRRLGSCATGSIRRQCARGSPMSRGAIIEPGSRCRTTGTHGSPSCATTVAAVRSSRAAPTHSAHACTNSHPTSSPSSVASGHPTGCPGSSPSSATSSWLPHRSGEPRSGSAMVDIGQSRPTLDRNYPNRGERLRDVVLSER